ncbi:ABC transporter permease [Mesorhizobium sp. BR1-1-2]|uniref:ABC transporter permease n=1 Tax=Mesorhizobium sp. BR1-1-2 TaxID=2876652 RepID=UPI001CCBE80D|nr:ABC transporter permease [Mesorhizobium sp. BR1-1-2]MBZ9965030.1 ABC transporter permease [Mesorhizobium sp. BR1-1-2]
MQNFKATPVSAVQSAVRHGYLVRQLIWREISGRYRGSFVGLLWSFINPLLLLAMYTFVFGVVFKARWGLHQETTFDFSLILFAGLILHQLFAECITRAPSLILTNPGYVNQVVFPLEILPMVALGSAAFHAFISLAILLAVWWATHSSIPVSAISIPFILLPLCLIALGAGWFLSSTTVYLRDVGQIVGFLSMGLMFLAPIFYPATSVPQPMRTFMILNPLTYVVETLRATLVQGVFPDLGPYVLYFAIALATFSLGYAWFQKTRSGFSDVL